MSGPIFGAPDPENGLPSRRLLGSIELLQDPIIVLSEPVGRLHDQAFDPLLHCRRSPPPTVRVSIDRTTNLAGMVQDHFHGTPFDCLQRQFQFHGHHPARRIDHQHIGPMGSFLSRFYGLTPLVAVLPAAHSAL